MMKFFQITLLALTAVVAMSVALPVERSGDEPLLFTDLGSPVNDTMTPTDAPTFSPINDTMTPTDAPTFSTMTPTHTPIAGWCGSCHSSWRGDGECDSSCYTSACNYDDGDCCFCTSSWRGDGECDSSCYTPGCNYDDGDCDKPLWSTDLEIHETLANGANDVTDTDETDEATDVEIAEDIPEPAPCKGGKCCEFYLNGDVSHHGRHWSLHTNYLPMTHKTFKRITYRNCKLKLYDNDAGQWLKWNQHVHLNQCRGRTWATYTAIYDLRDDLTQIRHKSCGA